jgi:hypothetical protein
VVVAHNSVGRKSLKAVKSKKMERKRRNLLWPVSRLRLRAFRNKRLSRSGAV